jgi:hypothetical protein
MPSFGPFPVFALVLFIAHVGEELVTIPFEKVLLATRSVDVVE